MYLIILFYMLTLLLLGATTEEINTNGQCVPHLFSVTVSWAKRLGGLTHCHHFALLNWPVLSSAHNSLNRFQGDKRSAGLHFTLFPHGNFGMRWGFIVDDIIYNDHLYCLTMSHYLLLRNVSKIKVLDTTAMWVFLKLTILYKESYIKESK